MKAIVLAGGFGSRLKSVIPHVPKPMAPIAGKPFLAHLLSYLQLQGINSVILSTHYLHEQIKSYFLENYNGLNIEYVIEPEPLGTGGAIANVFKRMAINEPVFALNGDSFTTLNFKAMYQQHQKFSTQTLLTIALHTMKNSFRYGKACVAGSRITGFTEKDDSDPGWINAGVYVLSQDIFASQLPKRFSFEKEFLIPNLEILKPYAYFNRGYFIDIGLPEDYARAQTELLSHIQIYNDNGKHLEFLE